VAREEGRGDVSSLHLQHHRCPALLPPLAESSRRAAVDPICCAIARGRGQSTLVVSSHRSRHGLGGPRVAELHFSSPLAGFRWRTREAEVGEPLLEIPRAAESDDRRPGERAARPRITSPPPNLSGMQPLPGPPTEPPVADRTGDGAGELEEDGRSGAREEGKPPTCRLRWGRAEGERRQRETPAPVGVEWAEETRSEGAECKMRGATTDMWAHEWVAGMKKKYEG
jgi:hypothetical protein